VPAFACHHPSAPALLSLDDWTTSTIAMVNTIAKRQFATLGTFPGGTVTVVIDSREYKIPSPYPFPISFEGKGSRVPIGFALAQELHGLRRAIERMRAFLALLISG
jgi:hypothetical protein